MGLEDFIIIDVSKAMSDLIKVDQKVQQTNDWVKKSEIDAIASMSRSASQMNAQEQEIKGLIDGTRDIHKQIRQENAQIKAEVHNTKEFSRYEMREAVHYISGVWNLIRGTLNIAGISMDRVTETIISQSINVATNMRVMGAIYGAVNPAYAAIMIVGSVLAVAEAVAQKNKADQLAGQLQGAQWLAQSMNHFIGGYNF